MSLIFARRWILSSWVQIGRSALTVGVILAVGTVGAVTLSRLPLGEATARAFRTVRAEINGLTPTWLGREAAATDKGETGISGRVGPASPADLAAEHVADANNEAKYAPQSAATTTTPAAVDSPGRPDTVAIGEDQPPKTAAAPESAEPKAARRHAKRAAHLTKPPHLPEPKRLASTGWDWGWLGRLWRSNAPVSR